MKWTVGIAIGALIVVGAVAGAFALAVRGDSETTAVEQLSDEGPYRGSEPPGTNPLPNFSLRNYDGRLLRSEELKGKVVLLTFLDSQCTEACPIIAAQIGQGLDGLSAAERRDVVAVAISTDPAGDTPANVPKFLRKQGALGRLVYLIRPERELRAVWKRFNILSSEESGEDTLHSAPLRIYERDLVWAATLHAGVDLTTENLVHDIRVALKEER